MSAKMLVQVGLFLTLLSPSAWGWGRRGHSMVCETAAYLASSEPQGNFLKEHSFDLEYYCNVPDFIWKGPATYNQEAPQHYMDLEIFERALKGSDVKDPYAMDRKAFETKFPQVPFSAGRAWWRIREMDELLMADRATLQKADLSHDARFGTAAGIDHVHGVIFLARRG